MLKNWRILFSISDCVWSRQVPICAKDKYEYHHNILRIFKRQTGRFRLFTAINNHFVMERSSSRPNLGLFFTPLKHLVPVNLKPICSRGAQLRSIIALSCICTRIDRNFALQNCPPYNYYRSQRGGNLKRTRFKAKAEKSAHRHKVSTRDLWLFAVNYEMLWKDQKQGVNQFFI